jgi:hypothetical protein
MVALLCGKKIIFLSGKITLLGFLMGLFHKEREVLFLL